MTTNQPPYQTRRSVLSILSTSSIIGLAGCMGSEPTRDSPDDGSASRVHGEWIEPAIAEAAALNPYRINDTTSGQVASMVLDGTYAFDNDDTIQPRWVESIESEDYRTYTVTLRSNLQWSDPYGPMTADDWVFYVENVATYEENWTGHVTRSNWFIDDEPIAISKLDDRTFELILPHPDPAYPLRPGLWAELILPKSLTEPYFDAYLDGDEGAGDALNDSDEVQEFRYTGNLGPYSFVERRIEDRIIFERNDDYYMRSVGENEWSDAPYFETRTIRILAEESTRLAELEAGGLTSGPIPSDHANRFEEMDHINVVQNANPFCSLLTYNQRGNGWSELRTKEVRHAMSYAIEKSVITEHIYQGFADVAHTFQPSWSDYFDDSLVRPFGQEESFNPEQSRELLESETSSGYGYDGEQLLGPDGEQVQLRLVYPTASDNVQDAGQYMQNAFEEIGIDIEAIAVPGDVVLTRYAQQVDEDGNPLGFNAGDRDEYTSDREWDMMWGIGFNTYPRTPEAVRSFWTENGTSNYFGYLPEADVSGLLAQAAQAHTPTDRQSAFAEVFGALSEEQPANFINFSQDITGYQEQVVHTEDPSLDGLGWGHQFQTWYFRTEP